MDMLWSEIDGPASGFVAGPTLVHIEVAAPETDIWHAVSDIDDNVIDTGYTGTWDEIAEAAAADYADSQAHDGAQVGMQVRATVYSDYVSAGQVSQVHTVKAIA